jgi:hypothetical protein
MSARVRALIIIVAVLGGSLGVPSLAAAQASPLAKPTMPEAREHLAVGNKLYNVRSFDEAITEYKAGALVEPAPVFDYNLGQCYRLTGKYQEAIWHYERFLARGKPQGRLLDSVNDFIAQMKSELDKKAMTQRPTEPAPSPSSAASAPTGLPSPLPPSPAARREQPDQSTNVWYRDGVGWGLTGAGVVGLGVAGGLLIDAASLNSDANAASTESEHARLKDKGHSRSVIGSTIGIVGGGLLVAGIIKLAVHSDRSRPNASWNITTSGNDVIVVGQF